MSSLCKEVEYKTSNLSLRKDYEQIFVFADKCKVYLDDEEKERVSFSDDKQREFFVEQLLAYYSYHLQNNLKGIDSKKENDKFVIVEYDGEEDVIECAKNPDEFKSFFFLNKDEVMKKYDISLDDPTDQNDVLDALVIVKVYGSDRILFSKNYQFSTIALYSLVKRPQKLYDGRHVFLTMRERTFFLKHEYRTSFYTHDNVLEPLLLDADLKKTMLEKIMERSPLHEKDKIYSFVFKDGDRDLIKAFSAIKLDYDYFETKSIEDFKENEKIVEAFKNKKDNEILIHFKQFKHNTNEILLEIFLIK